MDLSFYGLEESIGIHIILSNIMWWISLVLAFTAYRNRHIWNIGDTPWTFLFLTFLFFGLRELGHFVKEPVLVSLRNVFGIWSAIFMATALFSTYMIICHGKKITRIMKYAPFFLALIFPIIWIYLYLSVPENLKDIIGTIESLVWVFGSSIVIYTTYMLGTRTTGDFIRVFMFFQFAAYSALTWKLFGLTEILSIHPIPYSIREILETLFGIFAIMSMFVLTRMLRKLSRQLYDKHDNES